MKTNNLEGWSDKFDKSLIGDCFAGGMFCDNEKQAMYTTGYKEGFNKAKQLSQQFISSLRQSDLKNLTDLLTGAWSVELKIDDVLRLLKEYYSKS